MVVDIKVVVPFLCSDDPGCHETCMQMEEQSTTLALKIRLQNQLRIPASALLLSKGHVQLDDSNKTLEEYGVSDGDTLLGTNFSHFTLDDDGPPTWIPETEHRGICLTQLQTIETFVSRHALEKGNGLNRKSAWCERFGIDHPPLHVRDVNLYNVADWLIRPSTQRFPCSFVELISRDPRLQMPRWFCSHFWGDPIVEFTDCIEEHTKQHNLPHDSAYWICSYANNQHELGSDVSSNPLNSSFYRAMQICVGVLLILDKKCTPFQRIWCCFEEFMALTTRNRLGEKMHLEIASVPRRTPVVLTDGLSAVDLKMNDPWKHKIMRESTFPIEWVMKTMLSINVSNASASHERDKRRILNIIAGLSDDQLENPALEEHENYVKFGQQLSCRFALATWSQAYNKVIEQFAECIRKDTSRKKLHMTRQRLLSQRSVDANLALTMVGQSLPPNLLELHIELNGCSALKDHGVIALVRRIPSGLVELDLDFTRCAGLSNASIVELSSALPTSMQHLSLKLRGCSRLDRASYIALSRKMSALDLKSLTLNMAVCGSVGEESLVDVLCALPFSLSSLKLCCFGIMRGSRLSKNVLTPVVFPSTLVDIYLNFGNSLTDAVLATLGKKIPGAVRTLEVSCGSSIGVSELGFEAFMSAIPHGLQKLVLKMKACSLKGCTSALHFPKSISTLKLDFSFCIGLEDSFLVRVGAALPAHLSTFHLDLTQCYKLSNVAISAVANGLPAFIRAFHCNCDKCELLSNDCVDALLRRFPPSLEDAKLSFAMTAVSVGKQGFLSGSGKFWEKTEEEIADDIALHAYMCEVVGVKSGDMLEVVQAQHMLEEFQRWDINGDGGISKDELTRVLTSVGSARKLTEVEIYKLFLAADADKNGVIDYKEFVAYLFNAPQSPNALNDLRDDVKRCALRVSKNDIINMKCLAVPPAGVVSVLSAVVLLLHGTDNSDWRTCQKALSRTPNFLNAIHNFCPDCVSPPALQKLAVYTGRSEFTERAMKKECAAACNLVAWVLKVQAYAAARAND
eukprot:TRINITY_DN14433_c0_g1_i1.p1 TRINITY_DN14433_c0_g1~~TRINITY_DN14433_c0_g1_i1.p1  ORF type:complete len:1047 (+),score=112.79 TRINITY_DN14433_c0_g1_i1:71-3142(+)